ALRLFPRIMYIAKGDDDIFMRVPQFLSDLRLLPRKGIYWGMQFSVLRHRGNKNVSFHFVGGMCYTLSRDVAEHFVSYEPLKRLVHLPYKKEREEEFLSLGMDHEDVMVGHILRVECRYKPLLFVADVACRFEHIQKGSIKLNINPMSVVIHNLEEDEYAILMDRFGNGTTYRPRLRFWPRRRYIKFLC
ncbi:UDP-Gal or UDP-GlcNAc-dependent glycosyltransferase, partial [Trypanosoma theileri]